jgi:hypothetical protein
VLAAMRDKHFIPAYLRKPERKMIYGTKYKQQLTDNPQQTQLGDEVITLQWLDRRKDIPNRTKLFHQSIELMAEGEAKDWNNLPALLTGMKATRAKLSSEQMGKVVRKAAENGKMGVVIQCLQQAQNTGLTLREEDVLYNVIWALHLHAQEAEWSEEATAKALRWAEEVGSLLETSEHRVGMVRKGVKDVRRRAEVIGIFLELAAVQAHLHKGGKDVGGKVKMYAGRLLASIGDQAQVRPSHLLHMVACH